jgi:AcrR family transcriptional regulator
MPRTAASRGGPARRVRLSGPERRETFLDAAATIVARDGLDAVTMEGVAAALGVNKALPYRYFSNRDALLLALFDRETALFDAEVVAAVARESNFEGRVRAVIETYLDHLASSSLLVTQFEVSRPDADPFEARRRQREEGIVAYVAELLRDEYSLTSRDALALASILAAGSQGVVGLVRRSARSRAHVVGVYLKACTAAAEAVSAGARPRPQR